MVTPLIGEHLIKQMPRKHLVFFWYMQRYIREPKTPGSPPQKITWKVDVEIPGPNGKKNQNTAHNQTDVSEYAKWVWIAFVSERNVIPFGDHLSFISHRNETTKPHQTTHRHPSNKLKYHENHMKSVTKPRITVTRPGVCKHSIQKGKWHLFDT